MDLEVRNAGNVCSVASDFTVALHGVHIAEVNTAARNFHRTNQYSAGTHPVDVQMAICPVGFQLFLCALVIMCSTYQKRTEIAGVVGIGGRA